MRPLAGAISKERAIWEGGGGHEKHGQSDGGDRAALLSGAGTKGQDVAGFVRNLPPAGI